MGNGHNGSSEDKRKNNCECKRRVIHFTQRIALNGYMYVAMYLIIVTENESTHFLLFFVKDSMKETVLLCQIVHINYQRIRDFLLCSSILTTYLFQLCKILI